MNGNKKNQNNDHFEQELVDAQSNGPTNDITTNRITEFDEVDNYDNDDLASVMLLPTRTGQSIDNVAIEQWEMPEGNDSNDVDANIDSNQSHIMDLSNDIAINQMLADQGASTNPDAEIFNVHEYDAGQQRTIPVSHDEMPTDSQSFEYLPYYYVNQRNQINRPAGSNQFEKLTSGIIPK